MCGICGKVGVGSADVERDLLVEMCARLIHRGPDDEGIYLAASVGLGQRRLSIIDLSREAAAPLANEDGSIWVTFNGEIYNFQELRTQLIARGHVFRTGTDTEVLVHLYEEQGVECLAHLRGMFALAIWDASRKRLFAARDRLGKKPFYYARTRSALVFASEIRAILADPEVSAQPNDRAIDEYLSCQYVPSPETAFLGIHKLPPAHYLTFGPEGTVEVRRYWRPPAPGTCASGASDSELEMELLRRLDEAVRLRLLSDVPLGAFLSGGVDSSTVVALMARVSDRPVKTFSIGFEEAEFNELPHARQVAARYGTDHHEFVVRADAAEVLPELVRHYGEPFADSSALPTYYLSRMTRQHVTVALSGDGGDENFAGYENYRRVQAWEIADLIPAPARRAMSAGVAGVLDRLPYDNRTARLNRAASMLGGAAPDRFRLQTTIFKPEEKSAAYSDSFRARLAAPGRADSDLRALDRDPGMSSVDWMMWHDLHYYLPDCLMVKVDIASMANSLEVRCPLLDHTFVEFAATIPAALKRDASGGKVIFKRVASRLLPESIVHRRKTGFGVPLRSWFDARLTDLLRSTLLDDRARRRDLFNSRFVQRLVDDQIHGRRDWSHRLWALLCLELWFREFID